MKLKSKTIRNLIISLFILIGLIIFFTWQNNAVGITKYEYINSKIPKGFDSYKVIQISDLHNKNYRGRLSKKIREVNPDVIVITGDLIDRRNTRIDIATEFVHQIAMIAPIYYVSGNHEQLSGKYDELKKALENLNVKIIENSYVTLNKNGDEIGLMGIADPAIMQSEGTYLWSNSSEYVKNSISKLLEDIETDFNILLSHRPEQFNIYKDMNVDIVFSGHAHGGQIIIPFVGGLIAPNQGLFPKYTQGIYSDESTSMVVSRGLGNSVFPLRVFNPPELVVVTLKKE
jgi:predicted MPP superfamily phosphohydrolase